MRHAFATWLALAAVAVASTAHADREKAERFFRAGAQAFKQQNFGAAAAEFELAYHELDLPDIAFSAAQAYRRQYFIDPKPEYAQRAVELYRVYLDKVKTGGRVADASDGLAEMKRELDHLLASGVKIAGVHAAATRIAVSIVVGTQTQAATTELSTIPATDTTGAKATLDGNSIPLFEPIDVPPGDHVVHVDAPGYFAADEKRRVVDGATELVEVQLRPRPAQLVVRTDDGAHVEIDGRPVGDTPLAAQQLPAGRHVIAVTARGREPVVREVALTRGEAKTLDAPLVQTGKRRAVPWLLGASAVLAAGAIGTAIYAVIADDKMTSIERTRETTGISLTQLSDYRTWTHRRDAARTTAWILGGGAVVTGAVAAALYWFDLPRPTERTVIVPAAGAGAVSVTWLGRF